MQITAARGSLALLALSLSLSLGCSASSSSPGFGENHGAAAQELTLATARQSFATQWGPTAFNSAGAPDGYDDCGPTSLVMVASFRGFIPHPTASDAEDDIRAMRDLTRGEPTPVSGPTYLPMMLRGLGAIGAPANPIAASMAEIEAAVDQGAMVIVAGDPGNAWGIELDQQGKYLHHYGVGWGDSFGHWVVVFARAVDHVRFVVGDPLSTVGPIKVTGAALAQYMADYSSPAAIAVW